MVTRNTPLGEASRPTASGPLGAPEGGTPPPSGPLEQLLTTLYERLSDQIAGGVRSDVNLYGPEGQQLDPEWEGMLPENLGFQLPESLLDPAMFALVDPSDPAAVARLDLSNLSAASGPGRAGKGLDWYRSGQAPNNYANRNNPLYVARAQFVAEQVAPTIQRLFPGMSVQGQNYYRPPGGGGGQAKNSDHQSAGALDVFGTKEQMRALRDWLIQQPWTAFVRLESPHHYDHVHVSVDIGWVAENYFGKGAVPSGAFVTPISGQAAATHTQAREQTGGPSLPDPSDAEARRRIPVDPGIRPI